MGRCWTPSQRTPVQYNAGETRAVDKRLGATRSEVGTVCASSASTGLCGGQLATAVPTATNPCSGVPMGSGTQKAIRLRTLARVRSGPAESETPGMQRNSKRENREAPSLPARQCGGPGGERDER